MGLLIQKSISELLSVFSDADWTECPDDRRSTNGFAVFFGANLVSWSSRKETTVSCSSIEEEYTAIANATTELIWLQLVLWEVGVFQSKAPVLYCNNLGATYWTANPIFHAHTKHIEVGFNFVYERVACNTLKVCCVSSRNQVADIFTKALSWPAFSRLLNNLNLNNSCDWGGLLKEVGFCKHFL